MCLYFLIWLVEIFNYIYSGAPISDTAETFLDSAALTMLSLHSESSLLQIPVTSCPEGLFQATATPWFLLHGRAVVSKSEWPGGSLSPMVSSELDKYTSFLAFHWGQVSHGSAMTGSAMFHGVRQQNWAPKKTHSITSPSWNSLPSLTHFCLNIRVQRFRESMKIFVTLQHGFKCFNQMPHHFLPHKMAWLQEPCNKLLIALMKQTFHIPGLPRAFFTPRPTDFSHAGLFFNLYLNSFPLLSKYLGSNE